MPFAATTLYSNRFFHPPVTLLFPNLAPLQFPPWKLKYVLLLVERKNCGVRFPSGPSWGNAIVKEILDIVLLSLLFPKQHERTTFQFTTPTNTIEKQVSLYRGENVEKSKINLGWTREDKNSVYTLPLILAPTPPLSDSGPPISIIPPLSSDINKESLTRRCIGTSHHFINARNPRPLQRRTRAHSCSNA